MASPALHSAPPPPPPGRVRVALVEDDPIQAAEISRLLLSNGRLEWIGQWNSAEAAAEFLIRVAPDVVLVDIGLPGRSGIELVRDLKPCLPATQFMMLTVYEDTDRIFDALSAGATGYLLKKTAPTQLLGAIQELHEGGSPMSGPIARKVVLRLQQPARAPAHAATADPRLSPREREILDLLAQGRLYKEIADSLNIRLGTVRSHIRRTYEKLHARNCAEAVRKAESR